MEPSLITLWAAAIASVATFFAARHKAKVGSRTEASKAFLEICAHAHGRPSGRESIGFAEQLAAVRLIMELGDRFSFLREPAREALKEIDNTYRRVTCTPRRSETGAPWVEISDAGIASLRIAEAANKALVLLPEYRLPALSIRRLGVQLVPAWRGSRIDPSRGPFATSIVDIIKKTV